MADRVRENRLRRMAKRQGLHLVKNGRRDPRATDYGTWRIATIRPRRTVVESCYIDDVEAYLNAGSAGESGWTLLDGEAMNRKHPDKFHMPDKEARLSLVQGQVVKLCFEPPVGSDPEGGPERMWVIVEGRWGQGYRGSVNNRTSQPDVLPAAGEHVLFHAENVIAIEDESD